MKPDLEADFEAEMEHSPENVEAACDIYDRITKEPSALGALKLFMFSFAEIADKEGYPKALQRFCRAKRIAGAVIARLDGTNG